jgi:hypothetical protein
MCCLTIATCGVPPAGRWQHRTVHRSSQRKGGHGSTAAGKGRPRQPNTSEWPVGVPSFEPVAFGEPLT